MRQLDEFEVDALKEILNIGIGHAADSFSQMIRSPIHLSVPALELLYDAAAIGKIVAMDAEKGSMIRQSFRGGFAADGMLVFPGEGSFELVRMMVGQDMPIDEMRELEQDALVEVGNILFNSSVSVISDMIGAPFQCSMPRYEMGSLDRLLSEFHSGEDCLLLMNIAFIVEHVQVQGYLMFLMKVGSVEVFLAAIKKYFGATA